MTVPTVTGRCWGCSATARSPAFGIDPAVDVAVLPYSSGTTGVPKGVMLTHRNLCTNLDQVDALHRVGEGDRIIAILPFFHIFGLTALLNNALPPGPRTGIPAGAQCGSPAAGCRCHPRPAARSAAPWSGRPR